MNTDWQAWNRFLTIAESGSLQRAAEILGCSQPTLSRQLLSLEKKLGRNLFDRSTQGLRLTDFGKSLLDEGRNMAASANRLDRLAHGQAVSLTGSVRLSVNELIAQYYLPSLLPKFMNDFPELQVQVVVSNKATSLDKRDADVAVRMFRPHQQDIIMRHLIDIELGIYASKSYLEVSGKPATLDDLKDHRILGFDRDKQLEEGSSALNWPIKNEELYFRTDNMPLIVETAVNGGGIVFTHSVIAKKRNLVRIDCGISIPPIPVYLVCHRDVQYNQKIRVLMDFLIENLPDFISQ
ncbi:LysR family transcriptional regulator [Salinispirillum marinum]|uniref:LysR family transcriptional regulator n=2 Tax=Saccharospirillaceae TaxID=255527 RepID=A0ABV8BDF0_9GAMM